MKPVRFSLLVVVLSIGLSVAWAAATVNGGTPAAVNNTVFAPVLDAGAVGVNTGVIAYAASGNCGFLDVTAGARACAGPGANMFWSQDTNGNLSAGLGLAYTPSATPFTLSDVYVNGIPTAVTYGGGTLPAHAFTVQGIKFYVRTAGSGGSTNATFQVSDGTNTCNCAYACNQTTGGKRVACANGAGTGCVYAASAVLTYAYTGVGNCAGTSADIGGNISVEGVWQ